MSRSRVNVARRCSRGDCVRPVEADKPQALLCPQCRRDARNGAKRRVHVWTSAQDQALRAAYGEHYQRKALSVAMVRTGHPRQAVKDRAQALGLTRTRRKEPRWTDAEVEVVARNAWKSPQRIAVLLRRAGYARTETAVAVRRKRLHLLDSVDGYSAHSLAELLGVDDSSIRRWIRADWLRAVKRGTARTAAQGGDEWYIRHDDVREFVLRHPTEIALRKVPEAASLWFIDLVSGGACGLDVEDARRPVGVATSHLAEIAGHLLPS